MGCGDLRFQQVGAKPHQSLEDEGCGPGEVKSEALFGTYSAGRTLPRALCGLTRGHGRSGKPVR